MHFNDKSVPSALENLYILYLSNKKTAEAELERF